uniref:Uncharacterized protein n=1 Tax=Heterorhabditis bacteriophora TaxID=37862 RepID=A0A1I7WET8_HETBA
MNYYIFLYKNSRSELCVLADVTALFLRSYAIALHSSLEDCTYAREFLYLSSETLRIFNQLNDRRRALTVPQTGDLQPATTFFLLLYVFMKYKE